MFIPVVGSLPMIIQLTQVRTTSTMTAWRLYQKDRTRCSVCWTPKHGSWTEYCATPISTNCTLNAPHPTVICHIVITVNQQSLAYNKTSPTSSAVGDSSGVNATLIQVVQCQHVTVLSATCGHSDSYVVECAVATSSPHPTVPNNMRQRRHLLS